LTITSGWETRKDRILAAAVRLFRDTHNYNKVSIEEIARQANVSPTTIYNNFGNRDSLIAEVLKEIGRNALETYRSIVRADMPFPNKLEQIMTQKARSAAELDLDVIDKMVRQNPALLKYAAETFENDTRPMLLELIEDGKKQGYIDPDLSNEAILMYLEVLQESGVAFFRIMEKRSGDKTAIRDFNRILFHGFMKEEKES
jgi:AcrR family transcriptional regulator